MCANYSYRMKIHFSYRMRDCIYIYTIRLVNVWLFYIYHHVSRTSKKISRWNIIPPHWFNTIPVSTAKIVSITYLLIFILFLSTANLPSKPKTTVKPKPFPTKTAPSHSSAPKKTKPQKANVDQMPEQLTMSSLTFPSKVLGFYDPLEGILERMDKRGLSDTTKSDTAKLPYSILI